jgi:hypothetical protein
MSKTKIVIFIFSLLLVAGGGWYAYTQLFPQVIASGEPINAVPDNHAFILEFESLHDFGQLLQEDTFLFNGILGTTQTNQLLQDLDSLLAQLERDDKLNSLPQSPLLISVHFMGLDKFYPLFTTTLKQSPKADYIRDLLKQYGNIRQSKINGNDVFTLERAGKPSLFFGLHHGLLSISTRLALLEKAFFQFEEGKPITQDLMVQKMLKMAGEGSAHLYINHSYFYRFLSKYSPDNREFLKHFRSFAARTEFDVRNEEQFLLLSGYSIFSDSISSFCRAMQGHKAVKVNHFNLIPYSSYYVHYRGSDDIVKLNADLLEFGNDAFQLNRKSLKEKYNISIENDVYTWLDSEVSFSINPDGAYLIANVTDSKEAKQQLDRITHAIASKENLIVDTLQYRSYEIQSIPVSYFVPAIFGDYCKSINYASYLMLDKQVVFASSLNALQRYVDQYLIGQSLANNPKFQSFSSYRSNSMSNYFYMDLAAYETYYSNFMGPEVDSLFNLGINLSNLGFVSLELAAENNGVFTSVIVGAGDGQALEEEMPVSWQEALDSPVFGAPKLFTNHVNGKRELLVFDQQNSLYRLNSEGKIEWKIPIPEAPMSEIFVLDFYKNGKFQYAFNTRNYIFIIDLNGNRLEHFPFQLPAEAVGSMSLMDYDNNLKYRMLVPLADGKLHNFNLDRRETPGWVIPDFSQSFIAPVKHYRLGNKDFLLYTDTSGNVVFANRRGESRMETKLAFTNNPQTDFYISGSGSSARLVTTDLLGRVILTDKDGNVEKLSLGEFSKQHRFLVTDFNQDKEDDYVFFDNKRLKVFTSSKEILLDTLLNISLMGKMLPVSKSTEDSIRLIIQDDQTNLLYILSQSGKIMDEGEFPSQSNFIIEQATKNDYVRLITSNKRVLSNFLIK